MPYRRMRYITSIIGTLMLILSGSQPRFAQTITAASPIDTIGLYRNGLFLLSAGSPPNRVDRTVDFSAHPGQPVTGDWTGRGFDAIGTYDLKSGIFTLCKVNETAGCSDPGNLLQFGYGAPNNRPVAGRWSVQATHDGIGTFDTQNGLFFLRDDLSTGNPNHTLIYGLAGDQAIVGDWRGQGIDTPGLFRQSGATFLLSNQLTDGLLTTDLSVHVGTSDYPYVALAGHWSAGIGHSGVGLYDGASGAFTLNSTLTSTDQALTFIFGDPHDLPIVGHWSP